MKTKITALFTLILAAFINLNAQSIGTGSGSYTIAAKSDGTVYTWGANYFGQLGNGNTGTSSNVPVAVNTSGVLNGKTITQVAAGRSCSIALASDGTVYTWGNNAFGQLGNGNYTDSNVPVAVNTSGVLSGKTITQVAAGESHSIALASDGTVYTWGYNLDGQLGNGNYTDSNVPVAVITSGVLNGKTITQVAAVGNHSIALASDGTVYTWGYNLYGQLGNGNNTNSNEPVAVVTSGVLSGKTITQVAGGEYHSIALASDGTVYTWGNNLDGQLGNGNNTDSNVPVAVNTSGVLNGKTITQVAAGNIHSIALASDGTVYTWGDGSNGRLGNGNNISSNVPVAVVTSGVLSGKTITQVAAGYSHSIALASDGTVYTWGYNSDGQLGNGNNTHSNVPVAVDQSSMGLIPVELTAFTAALTSSATVELNWQTATETNNSGFEIQRSLIPYPFSKGNGAFQSVGFVPGFGTTTEPKSYSFTDNNLTGGKYQYRLKQIDFDGSFAYYWLNETVEVSTPVEFALLQNYPNPFNPVAIINYQLAKNSFVTLKVYDILGNEVSVLINAEQPAGVYKTEFNGKNLVSGIYIYKLTAGNFTASKKMMILK
ncbi:MAG: hypothetical protein AUK34_01090 [Ignavibacteria bacterium CG2_30_36_16]|nr:MAG: hypothetical protein AUK34_01090 [Ignavibacteria bacterium CG2_30_36_16]